MELPQFSLVFQQLSLYKIWLELRCTSIKRVRETEKAFNLENIEILDLILKILEPMFTFP